MRKYIFYISIIIVLIGAVIFSTVDLESNDLLTDEELTWVKENKDKTFFLGFYESPSEKLFTEKLAAKIMDDTGLNIEVYADSWVNTLDKLIKGEIHIATNLNYSNERAKSLIYTKAFPGITSGIFSDIRRPIESYDNLKGKTIGSIKGSYLSVILAEKYPTLGVNVKYYDRNDDLTLALREGEIDGLVSTRNYFSDMQEFYFFEIPSIKKENNHLGIYKGNVQLANIISKEVESLINIGWTESIQEAIYYELEQTVVPFSNKEREYINSHKGLNVGLVNGQYYNKTNRNVIKRISFLSGLDLRINEIPEGDIDLNYEYDLIVGRDLDYQGFSRYVSMYIDNMIVIGREESEPISELYALESSRLAVFKDEAFANYLSTEMPLVQYEVFNDMDQMVGDILDEKIDYAVLSRKLGTRLLKEYSKLSNKGLIENQINKVYISDTSSVLLKNIIYKSVRQIDLNNIINSEVDTYFQDIGEGFEYENVTLILLTSMILVFLIINLVVIEKRKYVEGLYKDLPTGLYNQSWFNRNMSKVDEKKSYVLIEFKIESLDRFYDVELYDKARRKMARVIKNELNRSSKLIAYNHNQFLIISDNDDEIALTERSTFIKEKLLREMSMNEVKYNIALAIGIYINLDKVIYDDLNRYLNIAVFYSKKDKQVVIYTDEVKSKYELMNAFDRNLMDSLLKEDIDIDYKSILNTKKELVELVIANPRCKSEVFGYFNNKTYHEGLKKFNLEKEVERSLLKNICQSMVKGKKSNLQGKSVVFHISTSMLEDKNIVEWTQELTMNLTEGKLYLALTEAQFENNYTVIAKMKSSQLSFIISNFGSDLSNDMDFGRGLIEYAFLDRKYVKNFDDDGLGQQVIQMLVKLSEDLDLNLIVPNVNYQHAFDYLINQNINYVSGLYIEENMKDVANEKNN